MNDTIQVPASMFVWIAGLVFASIGAMITFCAHLLININKSLNSFVTQQSVHNAQVELWMNWVEKFQKRQEDRNVDHEG